MDDSWKQDEHWKVINAGGRQISSTPEQLWKQAVDYFKWCDENPITSKRTLTSGKTQGEKVTVEYKRPYSIKAMCLHCNISERYITDIQDTHSKDSEYYVIMEKILMIIYTQNLEGAIVDIYNPIMVSKILNMDKGTNDEVKKIQVEVITNTPKLENSENEVLKKLSSEKVQILNDKAENPHRQNEADENSDKW